MNAKSLYEKYVVPSYKRFDLTFSHGSGSRLTDVDGKEYLDMGGGIAVSCLGHGHPELVDTLREQAGKMLHISNLYYHEGQGSLAEAIVNLIAPGKCFFCNSGAEANEGLFKLARKFGHDEGRYEIITARNSFHGRTLAGIAATGQDKVKTGFEPIMPGFRHVPFNDIDAVKSAISPSTVAVMIEGIQGEGGITPAKIDYMLALRRLCDERKLLLLMDEVQCGFFRTGKFLGYQRLLEGVEGGESFLPDGVSMAKSLAAGFPMGMFWTRERYADLLGPGAHASTFGGTPLACAVALKVMEIVRRDGLDANARDSGELIMNRLRELAQRFPGIITDVRGLGFIIGFELAEAKSVKAFGSSDAPSSLQFVERLHEAGLLTVPAGARVVRLLPPLNLSKDDAEHAVSIIRKVVEDVAS